MTTTTPHRSSFFAHRPMALAIATALAFSAPAIFSADTAITHATHTRPLVHAAAFDIQPTGTVHAVSNCDDSGPGSLRDTVASAVSGDAVDLSDLTCSAITLTGGAVVVAVDNLAITGPGTDALVIDGDANDRVLTHLGAGTLALSALSVRNGRVQEDAGGDWAFGGCVRSAGHVALEDVSMANCVVSGYHAAMGGCIAATSASLLESRLSGCSAEVPEPSTASAYGGAVFVEGGMATVDVVRSTITGSSVIARENVAMGGGICNRGEGATRIEDSTFDDNLALGAPYVGGGGLFSIAQGIGGGVFAAAPVTITGSTFSGNRAASGGALASMDWAGMPGSVTLVNSTITGNHASSHGGGLWVFMGGLDISNSTITLNRGEYGAGGIMAKHWISEGSGSTQIQMNSTVVAGNAVYAGVADVDAFLSGMTVEGTGNFVGQSSASLPGGTLSGDPMLAPLADNGGGTRTHLPLPGSPLIDAGSNVLSLAFDQRGPGFARVQGAAIDIGAVEFVDESDVIFRSGFEQVAP